MNYTATAQYCACTEISFDLDNYNTEIIHTCTKSQIGKTKTVERWTIGGLQCAYSIIHNYSVNILRPTNDAVNFRGRGWVECACMTWERSRNREQRPNLKWNFDMLCEL